MSTLWHYEITSRQQRIKGVETTATFDEAKDEFVFDSPTPSSAKNWISQGLYAEEAVILAGAVRIKPIALTAISAMVGAYFILSDPIFNGLAISLVFGLALSTTTNNACQSWLGRNG